MTDAARLLRELRPDPADVTPDEAALERIVLTPREPAPRRRRRAVRPVLAVAAVAAAALALVAVLPSGPTTASVAARAASALSEPDTIVYFRAITRYPAEAPRQIESWQTTNGRQERTIYDGGGAEFVFDLDRKRAQAYTRERHMIIEHTEPDIFREPPPGTEPAAAGTGRTFSIVHEVRALLERAASGADGVRLVGETEIRGLPVHHLRITWTRDSVVFDESIKDIRRGPVRKITMVRDLYLSRDDSLPVRLVEHAEIGPRTKSTVDFFEVERLPLDSRTAALLRMSHHPGARRVVQGPID